MDPDLTPEFAVVREALSTQDLYDRVDCIDHLFSLILNATRADLESWEGVAASYGADVFNAVDTPHDWDPDDVASMPAEERLAWVASAVKWLAGEYYGWGKLSPETVAGNDIWSPGGLVRGLVAMRERAWESEDQHAQETG